MDTREDEFKKRIHETFRIEAKEHLNAFSAGLIELEKKPTEIRLAEIIEGMFREMHSLKGAARSIDQKEIESICQALESVFAALKRQEITLSTPYFDLFYKAMEALSKLTAKNGSEQPATDRQLQRKLISELKEITDGPANNKEIKGAKIFEGIQKVEPGILSSSMEPAKVESAIYIRPISDEAVRIKISKLDPLLMQAEELIQSKKAINHRIKELHEINSIVLAWRSESLKWKRLRSMQTSSLWYELNSSNEVILNKLESQLTELTRSMKLDQYSLDSMVNTHLEAMRQVLMLPVSSIVESFPGMVREISREQRKEIEFIMLGSELEIDKRILEELKDPLIHLIRNSIDHGIGKPEERVLLNKPAHGTIILAFTAHESGMIEITLKDDGKGINKDHLLKAALKSGDISIEEAEKLNPRELLSLIYKSGISTSSIITDISGRGLGLSIVKEKVEKLNGTITVKTETNKGTSFHIVMPMTLTTFRGIVVKVKEFRFIIPTMNVERVLNVQSDRIKTVENHETISIDGHILSVADLGEVLGLPEHKYVGSVAGEEKPGNSKQIRLAILVSGEQRMSFRVDEILDEQQVLVKSMGRLLKRVRNISGATILGSGNIVPVLQINDLMKSALNLGNKRKKGIPPKKTQNNIRKILVADDSITARTLIRNILETAGYNVSIAVDGADAFTRANNEVFDLIVSDVDMPRMNGFELTAKIKHDKKLSEVPVVLITALGSIDDRERGIEAGADAYIVKNSFDQNNLLEIIGKLI
jgi:two-component system chemotaxis sensor kinase CheA